MSWAWMGPIPIPWLYESVAGSLAAPLFCGRDLGLTLVKAFCELHGGALTLESAGGFTATIELPAA